MIHSEQEAAITSALLISLLAVLHTRLIAQSPSLEIGFSSGVCGSAISWYWAAQAVETCQR